MVSSSTGRRAILALVILGFLASLCALWYVSLGGAVSFDAAQPLLVALLNQYIPLLAILAGFYFSERATIKSSVETSAETFLFAIFIVTIWVFGPPILLLATPTVEAAKRLLDTANVLGTSLTSGCLVYYFSKSAPTADHLLSAGQQTVTNDEKSA